MKFFPLIINVIERRLQCTFLAPLSQRLRRAYRLSVVCRHLSGLSKDFSKTFGWIWMKFHMQFQSKGGTNIYSNGHMTKIATMPIYDKNLQKSSPEPVGWYAWNLVCSIRYLSIINFPKVMTLDWPWPILKQGQICSFRLLNEKLS